MYAMLNTWSQRTTLQSQFSLSMFKWILGVELRSLGLYYSAFIYWAILEAQILPSLYLSQFPKIIFIKLIV